MRKSTVLFALLLLLPAVLFGVEPRIMANTGHTGAITSLEYHKDYDLLFTAGEDGAVIAWNTGTHNPVFFLRVSHYPIEKLTLNPVEPHIAVVEKRSGQLFRLSVWNWKTNDLLFSKNLEEMPLSLKFSPKGSYLVYSIADWNSLFFMDAETGDVVPIIDEGFGIVSDFIISSSENTIMTYSPSGSIQYWNLQDGFRKERIRTKSNIRLSVFTNNLRYMVGSDGDRLFLIDLINGESMASFSFTDIRALASNPLSDTIACAVWEEDKEELVIYLIEPGDRIRVKRRIPFSDSDKITDLLYYMNTVYIADGDNTIHSVDTFRGKKSRSGSNPLMNVDDLEFSKDKMVLSTPNDIVVFHSDFFTKYEGDKAPKYMYTSLYANPFQMKTALEKISDNRFLLWSKGGDNPGRLSFFNPYSGILESGPEILKAPLLEAEIEGDKLLTLEKDGNCRLWNYNTFDELFSYSSFGLQTVGFTGETIVAGKTRSTGFEAPLLQINPDTGETVPIYDSNVLIYDTLYNHRNEKLYSVGLSKHGTAFSTVLKEHGGNNFDLSYTIFSIPGEDLGGSITADFNPPAVYSTIGYEAIRAFSYSSQWSFSHPRHLPRKVYIYKDRVYSLNSDSSISIYDKEKHSLIGDLYIYADASWVVLLPTGHYFASRGGEKNITFYLDFIPYNGDTSDYRLEPQESTSRGGYNQLFFN